VVARPQHGTLTGNAPQLTYTPAANYHGNDSFTFRVNDGTMNSNAATVNITVWPVNDAPVAADQSVEASEDSAKRVELGASDVEGDELTYTVVTGPTHGTLSGTAPDLTYTPHENYNGDDSFTFKVNDGSADSDTVLVGINVAAINDAPVAQNGNATTQRGSAVDIALAASDADGDALTYTIVDEPQHGTLSGEGANRTYTPSTLYYGTDSFTFKVSDGTAESDVATVSIKVNFVNLPPTLNTINTLSGGVEDTAFTISYATLAGAANEADVDGDALSFRIESLTGTLTKGGTAAVAGTTLLSAGEALVWTPAANVNGTVAAFAVKAWDGEAASANAVTINVNVGAVNDAPTFTLSSPILSVPKNATAQTHIGWATNISAGAPDESAQPISFTVSNNNRTLFAVQPAIALDGTLTFTLARNKTGTATVTVVLQEGSSAKKGPAGLSTSKTFTITVQ
jgi:hypothetical protein